MNILLSNFAGGATNPKEKPTLEFTDILSFLLYGLLIVGAIVLFCFVVYKSTLFLLNRKKESNKNKICNNCNRTISVSYSFCPHCASSSFSTDPASDDELDFMFSSKDEKTAKIITIISLCVVISVIIVSCVINHRNSFDTHLNDRQYSYSYQIHDDRIDVSITAKVDIRNFSFEVVCYPKNNPLHQHSEYINKIDLEQGQTYEIVIYIDDIIEDNEWIEKWKLDSLKIIKRDGKVKNKDAIK